MAMIELASVDEFVEGVVRIFVIQSREIGVVCWKGSWFAVRNLCPHLGAKVCSGPLQPLLSEPQAGIGDLVVDHSKLMVVCPWHHWEFDLRTGISVSGSERLITYPVIVEQGRVMLDADRKRSSQSSST
jgi:nitrite reductase (NADH) small subunit